MLKDRYSYIALLDYEDDGISIEFPDLPGCLPCAEKDDTDGALKNAREALGLHLYGMEKDGEEIPAPSSVRDIHRENGQVPVLVDVFMPPVRDRIRNHFVKKTLSIPSWLNESAVAAGINFSQTLQEALKTQLGLQ